jgi:hypothetical protein
LSDTTALDTPLLRLNFRGLRCRLRPHLCHRLRARLLRELNLNEAIHGREVRLLEHLREALRDLKAMIDVHR